jgi:hypothetical protein
MTMGYLAGRMLAGLSPEYAAAVPVPEPAVAGA